jgi:hypothetical protein
MSILSTLERINSVLDDFSFFFSETNCGEKAKNVAIVSGLQKTELRSVCWKFFLELVEEEPNKWFSQITNKRNEYEEKKRRYLVDPHESSKSDNFDIDNLTLNNPLSQDSSSSWGEFFVNNSGE